ncbi:MAG: YncE family protein, partial [bacterium]
MNNRILKMLFVVLACTAMVRAQRVFTTIDPTEGEESLKFDVNSVPVDENVVEYNDISGQKIVDLNFSPNVVILPDSEKAFVSFPGTDQVVAFNPKTGEVLKSVEVGSNPGMIALSPDAKTVAVACVFLKENLPTRDTQGARIGSIVTVDVETYQTRTLALNDVFLSVANNVVFSRDGKQGFLPSMGSDELIRFDVATMEENSPRYQFTEGTRPASASVVPSSGLVTVVLSGSENLSRVDTPDSIALVDPDAFEVIEYIFPLTGSQYADEDGNFEILHDFTGFTNFAISADGRYGIIADQQIGGISQFPELGSDRAWLYDFETRMFALPVTVGGVAAGSYYAPDGQFVVIGSLTIAFVQPEPVSEDTVPASKLT